MAINRTPVTGCFCAKCRAARSDLLSQKTLGQLLAQYTHTDAEEFESLVAEGYRTGYLMEISGEIRQRGYIGRLK